nr:hypothetical protein Cduv_490 [Cedratvirus duvanny]
MFLLLSIVGEIFLFSAPPTCIYLSQIFRELDRKEIWQKKIFTDKLVFLPKHNLSCKEYYYVAWSIREKTKDIYSLEINYPLYLLKEDFLEDLYSVLSKKAAYGIYSLREKRDVLCLAMKNLSGEDAVQRQREIEDICFNFNLSQDQGDFGLTIRETKVHSYLFSSSLDREKVLFVLCYHGLL